MSKDKTTVDTLSVKTEKGVIECELNIRNDKYELHVCYKAPGIDKDVNLDLAEVARALWNYEAE